eukprot:m.553139 g.553139  ORF g.553139 m.553139 type:complete len:327 (+) comp22168_c0_seq33:2891-3871(+)
MDCTNAGLAERINMFLTAMLQGSATPPITLTGAGVRLQGVLLPVFETDIDDSGGSNFDNMPSALGALLAAITHSCEVLGRFSERMRFLFTWVKPPATVMFLCAVCTSMLANALLPTRLMLFVWITGLFAMYSPVGHRFTTFLRARAEWRRVDAALRGHDQPHEKLLDADAFAYVMQHERLQDGAFQAEALSQNHGDPPSWCRPGQPHVRCTRENVYLNGNTRHWHGPWEIVFPRIPDNIPRDMARALSISDGWEYARTFAELSPTPAGPHSFIRTVDSRVRRRMWRRPHVTGRSSCSTSTRHQRFSTRQPDAKQRKKSDILFPFAQ